MRLHFVTSNKGKLAEAKAALEPSGIEVVGFAAKAVEIQADDLESVARHKAEQFQGRVPTPYFLEDAGLFVKALGGFPGVYSRYAFDTIGCGGILRLMGNKPDRSAEFRAVIALVREEGATECFTGACRGRIVRRERGKTGFGFDPIFEPVGERRTFAELSIQEKSRVSHRGRALRALMKGVVGGAPLRRGRPKAI